VDELQLNKTSHVGAEYFFPAIHGKLSYNGGGYYPMSKDKRTATPAEVGMLLRWRLPWFALKLKAIKQ
jgi:hypothetical protein